MESGVCSLFLSRCQSLDRISCDFAWFARAAQYAEKLGSTEVLMLCRMAFSLQSAAEHNLTL